MAEGQKAKCKKKECTTLIEELALLKCQLKDAEDQLLVLQSGNRHTSDPSHRIPRKTTTMSYDCLDNFDLADIDEHCVSNSEDSMAAMDDSYLYQSKDRYDFYQAISRLIHNTDAHSFDNRINTGSLILCQFIPILEEGDSSSRHTFIDHELRCFDSIINACSQAGDLTAYISHYERAIFTPNDTQGSSAGLIAQKITRKVKSYKWPSAMNGRRYKCSIGIAVYPNDAKDIDLLFRYADRALYSANKIDDSYYAFYL